MASMLTWFASSERFQPCKAELSIGSFFTPSTSATWPHGRCQRICIAAVGPAWTRPGVDTFGLVKFTRGITSYPCDPTSSERLFLRNDDTNQMQMLFWRPESTTDHEGAVFTKVYAIDKETVNANLSQSTRMPHLCF